MDISTSSSCSDGVEYLSPIYIKKTTTITGVRFFQAIQGAYTADNTNQVGLYSYNGSGGLTLVASSTNNGNLWKNASGTLASEPFSAPYSAAPGAYMVGIIYNNSAQTTGPQFGVYTSVPAAVSGQGTTNSAKFSGYRLGRTALDASLNMSDLTNHNIRFALFLY
jgi:hypothetical protein